MDAATPEAAASKSRIEAKHIAKAYGGRRVVDGVNLSFESGEIVGLLGPNGAGKTTSFYMIVGLVPLSEGSVFMDEVDISTLPMHSRARMGIGYLPQEPSIFRKLTVEENLSAVAEVLPISKAEREQIVRKRLNELGISHLAKQKAITLSGGERRRLEIARALITEPKFILLDEPFSGVDPISVSEVQEIVKSLKDKGIGVLITDHNVRETLRIVDRAYLIHEGKVLLEGNSDFLVKDEQSRKIYLGENFDL